MTAPNNFRKKRKSKRVSSSVHLTVTQVPRTQSLSKRRKKSIRRVLFGTKDDETSLKRSFGQIEDTYQDNEEPPEKKADNTFDIYFVGMEGIITTIHVKPSTTFESLLMEIAAAKNVHDYELKVTRQDTNTSIRSGTMEEHGIRKDEIFHYFVDVATGVRRFLGDSQCRNHSKCRYYITSNLWNIWYNIDHNSMGFVNLENDEKNQFAPMPGYLLGGREKSLSLDESKLLISKSDPNLGPVIEIHDDDDDNDDVRECYMLSIWDISSNFVSQFRELQNLDIELPSMAYIRFSSDFTKFSYRNEDGHYYVGDIPQHQDQVNLPSQLLNQQLVYSEGQNDMTFIEGFSFDNTLCVSSGAIVVQENERPKKLWRLFLQHIPRGIHINMSVTPNVDQFLSFFHTSNRALMVTPSTEDERTDSLDEYKTVGSTYYLLDVTTFTNVSFNVEQHVTKLIRNGKSNITDKMTFQCITSDDSYALFLVEEDDLSGNHGHTVFAVDLVGDLDFYLPLVAGPSLQRNPKNWKKSAITISNNQLKISTSQKLYMVEPLIEEEF